MDGRVGAAELICQEEVCSSDLLSQQAGSVSNLQGVQTPAVALRMQRHTKHSTSVQHALCAQHSTRSLHPW